MREEIIEANEYFDKRTVIQKYDSMMDVFNYLKDNDYEKYTGMISKIQEEPRFMGTNSMEETIHDLQYGTRDITARYLSEVRKTNKATVNVTLDDFTMCEEGTIYDIGSVLAGVPECCIQDMPLPKIKKKLTIYLDMGFCWRTEAEAINNRGIALYNFINTLIKDGYIVDVYILCNHQHSSSVDNVCQLVKITNINNRPLLPHLAFGCTSAFFRAVSWMLEMMPSKDYSGDKTWKYGSTARVSNSLRKKFFDDKIFYIGGGYTNEKFSGENYTVKESEEEIMRLFKDFVDGKEPDGYNL